MGYHAFAIVAYDGDGFWLQNSWGDAWGRKGFARISYDEWLERGTDAWVVRLAVPVHLQRAQSAAVSNSAIGRQSVGYSQADLRRSEEHTSELQSLMRISYAVFCLKKKKCESHNGQ